MANMAFTLGHGWVGGRLETALWRGVRALAMLLPLRPLPATTLQRVAAA